jgi:hypothetical protein
MLFTLLKVLPSPLHHKAVFSEIQCLSVVLG